MSQQSEHNDHTENVDDSVRLTPPQEDSASIDVGDQPASSYEALSSPRQIRNESATSQNAASQSSETPAHPSQGYLSSIASDSRIRFAIDAAKSTVQRGREAISNLSNEVSRDERSNIHSALQASQFNILDVYPGEADDGDLAGELRRVESQERRLREQFSAPSRPSNFCSRLLLRLKQRFVTFTTAPAAWVFLIILGFVAALVAFFADAPVGALLKLRTSTVSDSSAAAGYFIWLSWCLAFSLVAGVIVHVVPLAEGSGIPQMKSILSGTPRSQYLALKVGVAKLVGLVMAQASGLSIGKEGPFVHITCAIASKLWKIPYFTAVIGKSEGMRRQMLAAAVAAGVTAVFGTPVGGVLFSVEVTSTYFLTSSYWKCFLCAIVCRFAFDITTTLKADTTLPTTQFPGGNLSAEVIAFAFLGLLCGLLGSAFVYCVNKVRIARSILMTTTRRRYFILVVTAAVVATCTYMTPYLRKSDKGVIEDLFAEENSEAGDGPNMADWTSPNVIFSLLLFIVVKFIVTVFSISLPVPCGLFIPLFVLGAALGRFVGELLMLTVPSVIPGAYAVVGAAALVSGATQTVSTAVIVFELTGQTSHLLPVLLATLVAYSVSSIFTVGMYDMLLQLAGLPYLPRVYSSDVYSLRARDIMHTEFPFLCVNSTNRDMLRIINGHHSRGRSFAAVHANQMQEYVIVDAPGSMQLCGTVTLSALEKAAKHHLRDSEESTRSHPVRHMVADAVAAVNRALIATPDASLSMHNFEDHATPRTTRANIVEGGVVIAAEDDLYAEGLFPPEWLDAPIAWVLNENCVRTVVPVDTSPFTTVETTPLSKLHYWFAINISGSQITVVRKGEVVGVITKDDLSRTDVNHPTLDVQTDTTALLH